MKVGVVLFATTAFAAPIAYPDIQEILAAHTQLPEFLKVHNPISIVGDRKLFASAHNPLAPNPSNAAAAASSGPATAAQTTAAQGILSRVTGGLLAKRDFSKRSVDNTGLYENGDINGKLNAKGMAALMRAIPMAQNFAQSNPQLASAQDGWANLKAFANTQGMNFTEKMKFTLLSIAAAALATQDPSRLDNCPAISAIDNNIQLCILLHPEIEYRAQCFCTPDNANLYKKAVQECGADARSVVWMKSRLDAEFCN